MILTIELLVLTNEVVIFLIHLIILINSRILCVLSTHQIFSFHSLSNIFWLCPSIYILYRSLSGNIVLLTLWTFCDQSLSDVTGRCWYIFRYCVSSPVGYNMFVLLHLQILCVITPFDNFVLIPN